MKKERCRWKHLASKKVKIENFCTIRKRVSKKYVYCYEVRKI